MKTKKLILGLGLGVSLLGHFSARAQGLEGVIVEKYYRSSAADNTTLSTLPAGSTTYRIYMDLAAGYNLQAIYGDASHNLVVSTTTTFYNTAGIGVKTGEALDNTALNTTNGLALDSYFTLGQATDGHFGVPKSEDTDGSILGANAMLNNVGPGIGIAVKTADGLMPGTSAAFSPSPNFLTPGCNNLFKTIAASPLTVTIAGDALGIVGGVTGATATNRVLIGQFTTDGIFHYQINCQVSNGGPAEKYVSSGASAADEQNMAALAGTVGQAPTISIVTNPVTTSSIFTGNTVTVTPTSGDADGTVASVSYYDGATLLGTGTTPSSVFTFTVTTAGAHSITAKATDNDGNVTTSAASTLTGVTNTLPVTAITGTAINPVIGGIVTTTVTITATATDTDGPIDSVAFFANNVRVGVVTGTGPYSFDWITTARGSQSLTVKAYDQQGGSTTSSASSISIPNPNAKPYFVKTVDTTCVLGGFCLPIHAKDAVSNVIGFDMMLHYNKAKVTPTGTVSAGTLVNPSFVTTSSNIDAVNGTMLITVSLNNAAPTNTFFTGIGELICVGFNKTSNFNSIDTATFTVDSIIESRYTGVTSILVDAGKYLTHKDSTLNASLKFWADNSALVDNGSAVTKIYTNNAAHNNKSVAFTSPNASGQFSETLTNALIGAGVTLNIDRDIAAATSVQPVVNGFDALLARKVVVNDISFIPTAAQMIAMDVNMDGKISAGDVSQINERSVLSIGEFKQAWNYNANGTKIVGKGKSKDWIFIDGTTLNTNGAYLISSIYPATDGVGFNKDKSPVMDSCIATSISNAASCPVIGSETYTGILLGDVNGNFKTIASDGVIKSLSDDKIVIDLTNATTANGLVTIPVSFVSMDAINAVDFSMQFDGGVVYNSIVNDIASLTSMSNLNVDDATLRFTSYSLDKMDAAKPVVSIVVEASAVNNGDLKSLTGYLNGEAVNVEVTGNGVAATATSNEAVSVYPNPANEVINVVAAESGSVQVIDMNGTAVVSLSANANQKLAISTANLANGVYTVKVSTASAVTVKMIVVAK